MSYSPTPPLDWLILDRQPVRLRDVGVPRVRAAADRALRRIGAAGA
jgi:hypothetical protein